MMAWQQSIEMDWREEKKEVNEPLSALGMQKKMDISDAADN